MLGCWCLVSGTSNFTITDSHFFIELISSLFLEDSSFSMIEHLFLYSCVLIYVFMQVWVINVVTGWTKWNHNFALHIFCFFSWVIEVMNETRIQNKIWRQPQFKRNANSMRINVVSSEAIQNLRSGDEKCLKELLRNGVMGWLPLLRGSHNTK